MVFVNKKLNEDEREALGFFRNEEQADSVRKYVDIVKAYTVDEERNAFLVGYTRWSGQYEFHWNGEVVILGIKRKEYIEDAGGEIDGYCILSVFSIRLPITLEKKFQELKVLLQECFSSRSLESYSQIHKFGTRLTFEKDMEINFINDVGSRVLAKDVIRGSKTKN